MLDTRNEELEMHYAAAGPGEDLPAAGGDAAAPELAGEPRSLRPALAAPPGGFRVEL